ncbi:MAG TPA: amino acid adenylation domain-containing protein [Longimicrobium sp.]|uniref:amino acid adenylation domain-containing protein n=1 Tax=Longimicrobium sp. TaxID=2029185 RepID=UPI002EDAC2CC
MAYMLEDSGVGVLLTQAALRGILPPHRAATVELDAGWDAVAAESAAPVEGGATPRTLAYVIYTSGSTGRPKGVMNAHHAVCNRLRWMLEWGGVRQDDRVLQKTPYSFDVSVWEFFCPLLCGATLVVSRPGGHRQPSYLADLIQAERITVAHFVPSMLQLFLDEPGLEERCASLRLVGCSGEALPPALQERFLARMKAELHNLYGPTEAAVEVTHWRCRAEPGAATVPIGRPIANTRVYVLDAAGGPTPIGVPGELHLGGVQVARGYLNRPALTAEKFVPDPFSPTPGARLYRTGDRARWRADGAVEFLGRLDFQVKVRGFRIELGEIETALAELPEVRECVVVALEQRLVAYVVAADGPPPAVRALREALARRLPDYMVPGVFVFLDALPLNPNGKLDRRALPAPETARADGDGYVAPATPVEEVMAEVWAAVLGVERVGAEDDFFALGGHSLSATRVAARLQQVLGVALPLRSFFESPTVAGMARVAERLLRDGAGEGTPPIVALQAETAPLSFAQRRLWFLERMEPGTGAYNVPAAFRLGGTLDVDALRRALAEVVRRHQVLRSTMDMLDGEPVQRVSAAGEFVLPVEEVDDAALGGRIAAEGWRPFDLERGPLFRAHLFRVAEDDHVLLLVMHHVVSDGWSYGVLMREVSALYAAFGRGEGSPLPPLAVQYADYAAWQRTYVSGEVLERQLDWWKARLAGAPAVLELPTDRPRTALAGHAAADVRFSLPAELAAELRALSRREGATLFMTLLAAWQVLLARYSGQDDVVVGSPIAGRARPEVEGLVGCFVNTLALRGDLSGDPGFRALLARVREDMLGAHAHQDLPFETLVEELAPERSLLHTPLFQVLFTLQKPERAPRLEGLALEMVPAGVEAAKFDLVLSMRDDGQRLQGRISYRTALFDESTAERMAEHLRVLLEGAMAAPELPVSRLPLLAADERRVVVDAWSATERPYGLRRPVHALIEAQAARTPDATAVVHEGDSLTYAELERGANRLAHHLVARGVRPDAPVGLFIERGIGLPAAVLGILKAGGAYVALDPQAPDERLRYVLHDAGARVVVSQRALAARLDGFEGTIVRLDDDAEAIARQSDAAPDVAVDADNLAYVIYTSGSTGAPKGVLVRHGGVANYLAWFGETVLGEDGFALPMVSRLSFDAHVRQLYPPLLRGEPVWVLPEETVSDAAALLAALRSRDRVSFGGVPSLWAAIVERIRAGDAAPTGLRAVLLGGETLPAALLERTRALLPGVAVWNHYGPTETTVNTSVARVEEGRVTIGRPIANVQVRLLDAALQPVPIGVPGELYAGGAGVARGYLGRPALTAEKFVPDPFSTEPGARMYRSGDRVRWLADGTLEYLGRADGQVKVRGFRIELGEIESVLARHPVVRESAVTARADEGDDARLVAYVAAREGADTSIAELRAHLAASLPGYMVPAAFVFLDRLPLTSSGKVDRRALPAPGPAAPAGGADDASYVAPRTQVEEVLAGIWAEVLGVPRVGVDDDFFALGGHSLRAMQVAARVQEVLRATVPLRALFESPTVAGVALHVELLLRDGDGEGDAPPPLVRVEGGDAPLSFAQRRLWFLERMEPGTATYNIPAALRLEGELDVDALHRALAEIVRRHQGLRTTFADAGGEPVQRVSPAAGIPLPVIDAADEAEARRRVMEEAARPFDLEHGPLFRAHLFRVSPHDHVLLLSMHHVVSDGWSSGVLLRELTALYDAFSRGAPSPLAELPVQYADYAAWQRAYLAGGVLQKQLAWWKERLAGAPAVLELPTDRPRPAARSNRGSYERFHLPPELADALRELSRKEGATLFMTLLAAWQALLGRYAGQDDVVVGAPIAGRTHREVEGLIGFFVNTLALRGDLSGDPTFRQLLARVRETTLGAYARQDLPFEKLVEEVAPARSLSHTPLFQTVFALDNTPARSLRLGSLQISRVEADSETSKFDLSLLMRDSGTALTGVLGYSADLFDAATVRRAAHHLRVLLRAAAANPDLPLSALSLVDEDEAEVLRGWSGAPAEAAPPARCVHHLFEEQARKTPEATALVYGDQRITYGELDRRANRLAHHLRGRGVGPDVKVGFCMERSPEMVVALLGILKAGGAYVPIDPAYPEERIAFMVREVDAPLLLTQERVLPRLPAGARALALDAAWAQVEREPDTAPDVDVTPDHLVYVLYTSGSTGTPKGSEVAHRAIPGFFRGADYVRYDAEQVLLQYSSTSWDVLTLEMWPALLTGATCVLYPAQTVELDGLAAEVRRHGVTTLWFSAAFFNLVIDTRPEVLAGVRQVMVGGEAVSVPHVRRAMELYPALRLVNGYGPSECTVFTSCHVIPRDFDGAAVPIGTPVGDRRVHVLDARMRPVPVGVPGELFVGGPAVPRGYLRRPALTARTLVPDPFGPPGGRLYRTGDRVRWRADGVLEYLGRIDQQVKVRGFRIELEEVEAVLLRSPAVREAVAVVREDTPGDRRLVAYAVAADPAAAPTPAELREHLRTRLPDYMLPSAFVVLDALPLNANRKVDRRALPAPEGAGADEGYVAPRTPTETTLAGIFAEVLNHERVGVHDDFFASGGHSLKATQVVSRAQDVFGVRVPLRALFEHPSVGALAGEVDRLLVQGRTMEVARIVPASRQARRAVLADLTPPGE